jgi:hypothetical protein
MEKVPKCLSLLTHRINKKSKTQDGYVGETKITRKLMILTDMQIYIQPDEVGK